jgi:hypothetical protein
MIDHLVARELASARFDGEASSVAGLDEHLAACGECARFEAGLVRVRAAALALPAEQAPSGFAARLEGSLGRAPARRWRRLLPAAAVAALAVLVVELLPVSPARVPGADAAEALTHIASFEIERVIDTKTADPSGGFLRTRTTQHIWFRAPGFVRVETRTTGRSIGGKVDRDDLFIARPGERYEMYDDFERRSIDVQPSLDLLPEPLSPTLAFTGRDTGPGPTMAGRPTRRYELTESDGSIRVAFVDAERFSVLGLDQTFVLGKFVYRGKSVVERKRTVSVAYNGPIDRTLFEIPMIEPVSGGFVRRSLDALSFAPRVPEGFGVVGAGIGRNEDGVREEVMLFTKGAFPILIEGIQGNEESPDSPEVRVGSRRGYVTTYLYALPTLTLNLGPTRLVRITAPLPTDGLVALAGQMYPE